MTTVAVGVLVASTASATVVFENPSIFDGGTAIFNPTSYPMWDGFVAQKFTLAGEQTLTDAEFTTYTAASVLTNVAANWMILDSSGTGGTPGNVVASDVTTSGSTTLGACGPFDCQYSVHDFALPSVDLTAGTYFFALQGIDDIGDTYISFAYNHPDLTYTLDGGTTWQVADNTGRPMARGYAITLSSGVSGSSGGVGGVPEPAIWLMLIAGFGLLGATLRRQRQAGVDGRVCG